MSDIEERMTFDDKGALDEIVTAGTAHLERIDTNRWFLSLTRADGSSIAIWFTSKDLCAPFWEERPASTPLPQEPDTAA